MGDAYGYAMGIAPPPDDLQILREVERFGVEAVMGRRVLYAAEIYRMHVVENVVNWYNARQASASFATWAMENPDEARLLGYAEKDWIERHPADE